MIIEGRKKRRDVLPNLVTGEVDPMIFLFGLCLVSHLSYRCWNRSLMRFPITKLVDLKNCCDCYRYNWLQYKIRSLKKRMVTVKRFTELGISPSSKADISRSEGFKVAQPDWVYNPV